MINILKRFFFGKNEEPFIFVATKKDSDFYMEKIKEINDDNIKELNMIFHLKTAVIRVATTKDIHEKELKVSFCWGNLFSFCFLNRQEMPIELEDLINIMLHQRMIDINYTMKNL